MKNGEVVEDPEDQVETPGDDVETGSNICQTEKQQTDEVAITANNGDVSAEDLDGSKKVPEVETLEDDDDTPEMTEINTKEEHT